MSKIEVLQEQYTQLGREISQLQALPFNGNFWVIQLDGSVVHADAFDSETLCKIHELGNAYGTKELALKAVELQLIVAKANSFKGSKPGNKGTECCRIEWSKENNDHISTTVMDAFDAYFPVYFDTVEDANAFVSGVGYDRVRKALATDN